MAGFVRIILLLVGIAIQLEYVHSQNPMHSKVCFQPLGMESRRIPDSAITASSERIYYLQASKARLHMRAFYPWLPAGWSASVSDKKQWLEINLEMKTKVTGIGTQGLSSRWSPDQWVTSYQVSYKDDGDTEWMLYKQRRHVKTFLGNKNANDVVINQVEPSFEAVCVRLHPQTWHRWISMRVELFGCPASSCFLALGLEDRRIPDVAFSSSSVLTSAHAPSRARLHSQVRNLQAAGWAPIRGDKTPWLQVDLGTSIIIAGIGTQGGRYFWWSKGGWVEKFKVSFKSGEDEWQTYGKNTSEEELVGNSDINSLVINKLSQPFVARLVRIHPILRTICGYLRLEFYGCPDKNECASFPCQNNATCIDHVNSFSCVCPTGFTGVTCETDKNECSSSPCKNNATCADHVNSFSCKCPAGFTGVTCETEIDECSSSPCLNNGTCHDHLDGFSCLCHPGFTGRNCESDIDECSSSPCLNSGSCVDHVNKFSCVCSQGFTGLKCESVLKPTCSCGRRTTRRIVGGQRALPGEWPWQAGLMVKNTNQIYCGGALINQEWIVTGAHCVTYRNASTLLVVLGEYDVTRKEGIELFREVDTFHMHPDYHLLTADFDIALVRFKPALSRFSRFISPVCLPTPNDSFPPGTNCTVTGFGRLTEAGRLATTLQQAVVPIVSRDTCQAAYPDYSITPRMMCAGYVTGGIDACQGDSGGPMVCRKDNTHWYLAGVISWGLGCARPESYGIYANVTVLASWVRSALINSTICTPGL